MNFINQLQKSDKGEGGKQLKKYWQTSNMNAPFFTWIVVDSCALRQEVGCEPDLRPVLFGLFQMRRRGHPDVPDIRGIPAHERGGKESRPELPPRLPDGKICSQKTQFSTGHLPSFPWIAPGRRAWGAI